MRLPVVLLILAVTLWPSVLRASTLAPELKAYDFAEAYYIEDGGVVIVPYHHGFYCDDYIQTPEGIRIMPGGTFMQYDPSRMVVSCYTLLRLNKEGTRAFFNVKLYHYKTVKLSNGKFQYVHQQLISSDDFYLSKWRSLEWFDFAIPYVEIHPSAQNWRTRSQYY